MSTNNRNATERRVLILTPTGKDAVLTESVLLKADVASRRCADGDELCQEMAAGAGTVLIAEEAISNEKRQAVAQVLHRQPPWSDLPIIVLTHTGVSSATVTAVVESLGNV